MESTSSNEDSLPNRFKSWFEGIPFITRFNKEITKGQLCLCFRCIFLLCLSLYLTELILGWDPTFAVCLHVPSVTGSLQIYRILTAAFFHVGLLHVTFNMLAFIPIASEAEKRLGTVKFSYLILLIVLLAGILYILLTSLLSMTALSESNSCTIGFSGVIFGVIVIHTHLSSIHHYSMFGLFPVPAKLYAWVLLIIWQLLLPGISFIGHLSGILVGQMYVLGCLAPLELSDSVVTKLERSMLFVYCTETPSFILVANTTSIGLPTHSRPHRGDTGSSWAGFYQRLGGFGFNSDERRSSGGQSSSGSQNRFPGQANYLSAATYGQDSSIPIITEAPDPNEDFDKLVEMGFDAPSVRAALLASDGDFTVAMNKLTGQS